MTPKKHPTSPLRRLIRALLLCLNAAASVLTFGAAYGGMVNPAATVIPALLTLTLPVWLAAIPLLLAIDLLTPWKRLAAIPAFTMLMCAGPAWDYCPLRRSTAAAGAETMEANPDRAFTVLSYNTFALTDYRMRNTPDTLTAKQKQAALSANLLSCPTLSYILDFRPTVGLLQENPQRGINILPHVNVNQAQLDSLNTLYPFYMNHQGESIMSTLPLRRVSLRQPQDPGAWFAAAEITVHGTDILFVSVHLQSIGLTDTDKQLYRNIAHVNSERELSAVRHQLLGKLAEAFRKRARQADLLCQQLDSIDHPNVIIGGDFNDVAGCYAIRQLEKLGFRTVFSSCGSGPTPTYHANRFIFQIDHILYRGSMTPAGYRRGNARLSDHYPVLATFLLPPPETAAEK